MAAPIIRIYRPDQQVMMKFSTSWAEIIGSLARSRELIFRLFIRDYVARYRQSLFGVLWAVIHPFITMGIFLALNRAGLLTMGDIAMPYPVFAFAGLSLWTLFATGLTNCSNSIVSAGVMVTKINFPKASLVIASMGQALIDCGIRLVITFLACTYYGVTPAWTVVLLPVVVLPLLFLTLGIGLFFALLAGVFRDTVQIVNVLVTLLLFVVPVLYLMPERGTLALLNLWNPLSYLITGGRDLMFLGWLTSPVEFVTSALFSVFVLAVFLRFFYIVEPKIAERI